MSTNPTPAGQTVGAFDVAVVGAGPAGLAAAVAAADRGKTVVLVDAGAQIGGQYWRHPDERAPRGPEAEGHHDWKLFTELREKLRRHRQMGAVVHLPNAQVWFVEPAAPTDADDREGGWTLHLTSTIVGVAAAEATPRLVVAARLILCPGGYDRQLPVPGWDLPGVMAAGGVQALLKGHRTLAGQRAVVAGTGPFLLPVAKQLADAGATVVAVCEANTLTGWARHARAVAALPAKVAEGAEYALALARHRIPYRTRTAVIRIDADPTGTKAVQLARLDDAGRVVGPTTTVDVDLVALGWGFTPSMELITAVGAQTRIDVDQSLVAVVDDSQRSTMPGVYVAGEATGVGGALLAVAEGELAGIAAADALEDHAMHIRRLRARIQRLRVFAAAMHQAHPIPARWHEWLTPDTTICRCEEVSFDSVCRARDELGATDVRTVKLLARPGMGWCQGHVCGFATAELAAAAEDRPLTAEDLRPLAKQPLCAPIALELLAQVTSKSTDAAR
ncbi:FAD-dependent oxidoreductase [Nocardia sp. NPDC004278]